MTICVQHSSGWCATYRRKSMEYNDHIKTLCGGITYYCLGIEKRKPTCTECLAILKKRKAKL